MKLKTASLVAGMLLPFSMAQALVIQIDSANVDVYLTSGSITAVDSASQINLWDFNSDTFVFNGYNDDSYTLLEKDNSLALLIEGSSNTTFTLDSSADFGELDLTIIGNVGSSVTATGSFGIIELPDTAVIAPVITSPPSSSSIGTNGGSTDFWDDLSLDGNLVIGGDSDINGDIVIDGLTSVSVPEPGSFALLMLGLFPLLTFRRRMS